MSSVTSLGTFEDLTETPDPRFRRVVDAVAAVGDDRSRFDVVVRHGGREVLRVRSAPSETGTTGPPSGAPLLAVCGSAFKPALAICLLEAAHRAGVEVDAPLSTFGPGFRDARTTLREVIDHRAGLPHVRAVAPEPDGLADQAEVTRALRDLAPLWPSGTRTAYHAISYGFLIDTLCRDLTGRSLREVIWELVLSPAGIQRHEALLDGDRTAIGRVSPSAVVGDPVLPWRPDGRAAIYASVYELRSLVEFVNRDRSLMDPVLSCGVACEASALAKLYEAVISPVFSESVHGLLFGPAAPTFDLVMRQRLSWVGGCLQGAGVRNLTARSRLVGLPGYGGSIGWVDADRGVAVGIVTTRVDADRVVSRISEQVSLAVDDALSSF